MNNRQKISSLSKMELAQLLGNLFFLTGKDVNLTENESDLLLDNVYKYHGGKYIDEFSDAFSKYAAGELPDAETLKPQVSPRFVSLLMKIYFKKSNENKRVHKSAKNVSAILTPEEKYTLFVQFIVVNQSLPGNSDWVSIYEYITGLKKLCMPPGWDSLSYYAKWKHAMKAVTGWVYNNFNITEVLLYKDSADRGTLKGIGTRIEEALWSGKQ